MSDHLGMRAEPVRTARVWQALDLLSSHNANGFVRKSWSDTPIQAFAATVVKTWTPPRDAGDADAQADAEPAKLQERVAQLQAEMKPLQKEMKQQLDKELKGLDYMFISSVAQQGLTELKDKLWKMLNI